ncbi:DUF4345 domain-containing protein [Streptomyces sp. NPDC048337]|uniref:DUF4345 domain-containing protein n=1 Tax=Streptomyces sp. NPDC048337 TaxID=3365535 RepID=UPI003718FADE
MFPPGAAGRLLSRAVHGWPHGFQVALTVVELVIPPLYFRPADADEKAHRAARTEAPGPA